MPDPMSTQVITAEMDRIVRTLQRHAQSGLMRGLQNRAELQYMLYCTKLHGPTGVKILYTRDSGHHTSGWLKNPDYERCLHLSLSFWEPPALRAPRPYDRNLAELWVRAFFGDQCRLLWEESPFSVQGRLLNVRHWRLFCDAHWQPILPRGEVYSTEFTEAGWKSWSELHGDPLPTRAMQQAQ